MSIIFTVIVYLTAGLAIVVWLAGERRLPAGTAVRIGALIFWPAYLPICLSARTGRSEDSGAPPGQEPVLDPTLDQFAQQIARLPIGEARRSEYRAAAERLGAALDLRRKELARLVKSEERLQSLGGSIASDNTALVDAELAKVRAAKESVDRDIARAKEGVLRLVLRLEVIDLEGSRRNLDAELSSLEDEIGRLLDAHHEADALTAGPSESRDRAAARAEAPLLRPSTH